MFLATVFFSVLFTMSTFICILLFLVLQNQFNSHRHVAGSKLANISIALRSDSTKTPLPPPVPSPYHARCGLWAILHCCTQWANSSDWQYVESFFFLSHCSCWPQGLKRLSKLWSHCWHSYRSDFDRVSRHRSLLLFLQFLRIVLLLFPGPMRRRKWR